ncbi:MAG: transposase [Candidatus ainarchaeum sp.]|nr:transposase [Candidatus ainarchaeum sp.]
MIDKIILNYKYLLQPTKQQRSSLWNILQSCRHQYNEGLELWNECYECCKIGLNAFMLNEYFKDKYQNVYSQVKQNVNKRLETSFKNFFDKRSKYPKFKSKNQYRSFTYPQSGFKLINDKKIKLSGIGEVKLVYHRPIIGKIKTCALKLSKTNKWYAIFSVEVEPDNFFELPNNKNTNAVGLDIGIKTFASLSDGTQIDNPKFLVNSFKKIKRAQRKLSHKKKGSHNRKKQIIKLAKLHERVTNQRKNFHFQIAHWLVNNYGLIAVEKLSPQFMIKNHKLAKSASDIAISQFFNILTYEAYKHQTLVGQIDPKNTSQICSKCGKIVLKDLSVRTHQCPYCGFVCDRDINAAINIVDRVPDEFKQKYNFLRNGTVGMTETLTPVETSTAVFESKDLKSSVVDETGSSLL